MTGYVLSKDAEVDLQDIFSYGFGAWGEKQATKYLYDLYDKLEIVGKSPGIGRHRPELHSAIQAFPSGSHVVFFMPWNDITLIVRVIHAAADHESAFEGYDSTAAVTSD